MFNIYKIDQQNKKDSVEAENNRKIGDVTKKSKYRNILKLSLFKFNL